MIDKCFLYWIRKNHHTDIKTQGYIGISHDPVTRLSQHRSNSRNIHHRYNREFKDALLADDFEFTIIVESTRTYCINLERLLRPLPNTGWNLAIGGEGGYNYKHGLTNKPVKKDYYNMLTRAKLTGSMICSEWLGDGALERFNDFRKDKVGQMVVPKTGIVSPETLKFLPRSEILRSSNPVNFEGNTTSIAELGERFKIKPNTITTRLRRGWTLKESIYGK